MDSGHREYHSGAVTPAELIAEARRWLGTPYRHQGRDRHGFDCVGYVIHVAANLGIMPRNLSRTNYGRLPQPELLTQIEANCLPANAPGPGTLILIRWEIDKRPSHCALCSGETLLHTYQSPQGPGKAVEHGYRGKWLRRTVSVWRLPGVVYG